MSIDELPTQRAEEVREHLLDCDACLAQMRELLRLPETPPLPEMAIEDEEQAIAWKLLKERSERLEDDFKSEKGKPTFPSLEGEKPTGETLTKARPPRRSTFMLMAALAAGAAIGLAFERLRLSLPTLSSDLVSAGYTHLIPRDYVLRGETEDASTAMCPNPGGQFVWVLNFNRRPAATSAEVKVTPGNGQPLGPFRLPITGESQVVVVIPWEKLPDDRYRIRLEVETQDPQVAEFVVKVDCR